MSGIETVAVIVAAVMSVVAIRAGMRARLRSRLASGERAALGASVDDPRFDPRRIHAAAALLYRPLAGTYGADQVHRHGKLFGTGQIRRMFALGTDPPMEPAKVRLRFAPRPTIAVVRAQLGSRLSEAEVVVRVETRLKSWPAHLIATFWVFGLDERSEWQLKRVEPWVSGRHYLRGDATGESDEIGELRSEAARELEAAHGTHPIARELASNLPDDQQLAADELGMVDGRFDRQLIRASVEEIADAWASASDGAPNALAPIVAEPKVAQEISASDIAMRSPEVHDLRVTRIHRYRTPPEITVKLKLRAWRGPRDPGYWYTHGVTRTEDCWWRLRAGESAEHPWPLIDPAAYPEYPLSS